MSGQRCKRRLHPAGSGPTPPWGPGHSVCRDCGVALATHSLLGSQFSPSPLPGGERVQLRPSVTSVITLQAFVCSLRGALHTSRWLLHATHRNWAGMFFFFFLALPGATGSATATPHTKGGESRQTFRYHTADGGRCPAKVVIIIHDTSGILMHKTSAGAGTGRHAQTRLVQCSGMNPWAVARGNPATGGAGPRNRGDFGGVDG